MDLSENGNPQPGPQHLPALEDQAAPQGRAHAARKMATRDGRRRWRRSATIGTLGLMGGARQLGRRDHA